MKKNLRQLINKEILVLPGAFNALSAKLIEKEKFSAIYVSGAAICNGLAAIPDIGLLTLTELAQQVQYIARAVKLPLLVDADTGFGGPRQVGKTVKILESHGAGGIQIEDQKFPKKCGHLEGKKLISTTQMIKKIQGALKARKNKSFLIVARTDARAPEGFDAACNRAISYFKAGADVVFPEALKTINEFRLFRQRVNGMLLVNMTEFGKSPYISVRELSDLGYNAVLFPMSAFRVMSKAVGEALRELKKKGTQKGLLHKMQSRKELYKLLNYQG